MNYFSKEIPGIEPIPKINPNKPIPKTNPIKPILPEFVPETKKTEPVQPLPEIKPLIAPEIEKNSRNKLNILPFHTIPY